MELENNRLETVMVILSMEKKAINAIDEAKSLEGHKNEPVARF